jgi:hypothetical protein
MRIEMQKGYTLSLLEKGKGQKPLWQRKKKVLSLVFYV